MNVTNSMRRLSALVVLLAGGCAPAYHSYSSCYVNCKYCAPSPLPYTHYNDCVCHSCAASEYMTMPPATVVQDNAGDTDHDVQQTE